MSYSSAAHSPLRRRSETSIYLLRAPGCNRLVQDPEIVDEPGPSTTLPTGIQLPPKDQPILLAAIQAKCTHLLTGDRKHFGQYFQQSIGGVRVLTVRDYLTARGEI